MHLQLVLLQPEPNQRSPDDTYRFIGLQGWMIYIGPFRNLGALKRAIMKDHFPSIDIAEFERWRISAGACDASGEVVGGEINGWRDFMFRTSDTIRPEVQQCLRQLRLLRSAP